MFRLGSIAIATIAALLSTLSFAANYAVGTCDTKLASYTTISQAVSSVPPGATILVCPNNYPEQVLITRPLTIKGFPGQNAPVIVVPPGGLVSSLYSTQVGTIVYQVAVNGVTGGSVNLSGLIVDGTGNLLAPGCCDLAGVYYQDASGTVDGVSVRNQTDDFGGFGIMVATVNSAASQAVTIENSDVRGYDAYGMYVTLDNGPLAADIKANVVENAGGFDGIYARGPVTGTIAGNLINNSGNGFDMQLSGSPGPAMTVSSNTILVNGVYPNPNIGILAVNGSSTIKSNTIDVGNLGAGIVLAGSASGSTVQSNTITNAPTGWGIIGCSVYGNASGFTVTGNIIVDASTGVDMPSGNTSTANKFFAVTTPVATCP